jgi:glycosyltransferase involved in cell wall biosynthesis
MAGANPTLLCVAPYRVYPPTSGGGLLIDGVNRALATSGCRVNLFSTGFRRGQGLRGLFPQQQTIAEGYTVHNYVSPLSLWMNRHSRQATGIPPIGIDAVFSRLKPSYLARWSQTADLIQVEGPFGFKAVANAMGVAVAVADTAAPGQPLVLMCHNVESELARTTLGHLPDVVAEVEKRERWAVQRADGIIVLTEADKQTLLGLYGVDPAKIRVVPVGVDLARFQPPGTARHRAAKERLGLSGKTVAVFTGARYEPNVEAVRFLESLAADPALPPDLVFLVLGRVGEVAQAGPKLIAPGFVDDVVPYLHAADMAVNPMALGGGMHLKMLEFFALGLPVLSTPFGLRGITGELPSGVWPRERCEWLKWLQNPPADDALVQGGEENRTWVADHYGWGEIARRRMVFYRELMG